MEDCQGRPITDVTQAKLDSGEVEVREDGTPISSEAAATLLERRGLETFVTILIDVSTSTTPVIAQVEDAVRALVTTLNDPGRGLRDHVHLSIGLFAGDPTVHVHHRFDLDLDRVLARVDAISDYAPPDASSTNLHGAIVAALQTSHTYQADFVRRNRGGAFTTGYLFVFTDGTDTSRLVTQAAAAGAIAGSTDDVIAVGLEGRDYDPAALRSLVGANAVIDSPAPATLSRDFAAVAARIAGQLRRTYLLGYCSPSRSGDHSVSIGLRGSTSMAWGADPTFSAASFGPGCAPRIFADGCTDKECGGLGCGACDDRVGTCDGYYQCAECEGECLGIRSMVLTGGSRGFVQRGDGTVWVFGRAGTGLPADMLFGTSGAQCDGAEYARMSADLGQRSMPLVDTVFVEGSLTGRAVCAPHARGAPSTETEIVCFGGETDPVALYAPEPLRSFSESGCWVTTSGRIDCPGIDAEGAGRLAMLPADTQVVLRGNAKHICALLGDGTVVCSDLGTTFTAMSGPADITVFRKNGFGYFAISSTGRIWNWSVEDAPRELLPGGPAVADVYAGGVVKLVDGSIRTLGGGLSLDLTAPVFSDATLLAPTGEQSASAFQGACVARVDGEVTCMPDVPPPGFTPDNYCTSVDLTNPAQYASSGDVGDRGF